MPMWAYKGVDPRGKAVTGTRDADTPKLKGVVSDVRLKVNEGSSLADALGKHGRIFQGVFISMARAGETAGNLDQVLVRLADFLEAQVRLKSKVVGAMIYPILMACV